MALPSHICGYPVQGDGHPCRHRVADPQQRFCDEHEQAVQAAAMSAQALIDMVPADRKLQCGNHVWDQAFPSAWCLVHRQLAATLEHIGGWLPCIAELDARDPQQGTWQAIVALHVPADQLSWVNASATPTVRMRAVRGYPYPDRFLEWVPSDPVDEIRQTAAARMEPKNLHWALQDACSGVRAVAARRAPLSALEVLRDEQEDQVLLALAERPDIGQLHWAREAADPLVRLAYLRGRPDIGSESWAKDDPYPAIRAQYAQHCPVDQLCEWGPADPDPGVRQVAVQRMPIDQLGWAAHDPSPAVRRALLVRAPTQYADQMADDPDPALASMATSVRASRTQMPDPRQDEDLSWFLHGS